MEARGDLTAVDFTALPFTPVRAFSVTACPPGTVRGRHAHREGTQLLVCTGDRITVELRRDVRRVVGLHPAGPGLLVPPGVWAQQTYHTPDSALLVLASHPYDPEGYLEATVPSPGAHDR